MAKISKMFRLSEQAIAVLDSKDNATQFVEELILNTESISRGESLILEKLDGLSPRTEAIEAPNLGSTPSRSKREILEDITHLESQRDEELAASQDVEYSKDLKDRYQSMLKELWDEYNS